MNFRAYRKFTQNRSLKIRKQIGLNFGWKFDTKKFNENLIEPKSIGDMDEAHRELILEAMILLLERGYSYYLEYKSNTSRLSKRVVQKRLSKAERNLDKFLGATKEFLSEKQKLELTVYKHNLRAHLFSLK